MSEMTSDQAWNHAEYLLSLARRYPAIAADPRFAAVMRDLRRVYDRPTARRLDPCRRGRKRTQEQRLCQYPGCEWKTDPDNDDPEARKLKLGLFCREHYDKDRGERVAWDRFWREKVRPIG